MTPERKLKKAKIDVMRSQLPSLRLWAGLMTIGKTTIDDTGRVPTAATNGRDEVYGRAFIEMLPVPQLAFVALHEAMHKGLRHLTTWKKLHEIDHQLANIACDYVVNRMITQADPNGTVVQFPRTPDGNRLGVYDETGRFNGLSAKQIFDILRQEQRQNSMGGKGSGGQGGQGNQLPDGFDEHEWEEANAIPKEEMEKLERDVDYALRRGEAEAKQMGAGKGDMPAEIGELLRPGVDWRTALREFITAYCANKDQSTWRRLNRRVHALDLSLPSLYGESLGHIVVGADLSGSMWGGNPPPINRIFTEIVEIANTTSPERMDVLYWDTEVAGHDTFKQGEYDSLLQRAKPKGGGGTDAACVPKYMKEHKLKPDCVVMITDGYIGNWGTNYPCPVLWVVVDNPNTDAPIGKTIHVKE
jgi:predicted metal-dependent peptidase